MNDLFHQSWFSTILFRVNDSACETSDTSAAHLLTEGGNWGQVCTQSQANTSRHHCLHVAGMQPCHTRSGAAALLRWNLWSVRHLVRHPAVQLAMLWMPSHWIQASGKTDSNTSSDKAFEDKSLFWPFDKQPRAYSGLVGCLWIALHIFSLFPLNATPAF